MHARAQGSDELVIDAGAAEIWAVLEDSRHLSSWAPMVISTTGTRVTVGSVRECEIDMDGKPGRVVERCVEAIPMQRIAWVLQEDTFGFNKMLDNFGFAFELEPRGEGHTLVRTISYYEPKNVFARVMNVVMMRRKFASIRTRSLQGLQLVVESESKAATS